MNKLFFTIIWIFFILAISLILTGIAYSSPYEDFIDDTCQRLNFTFNQCVDFRDTINQTDNLQFLDTISNETTLLNEIRDDLEDFIDEIEEEVEDLNFQAYNDSQAISTLRNEFLRNMTQLRQDFNLEYDSELTTIDYDRIYDEAIKRNNQFVNCQLRNIKGIDCSEIFGIETEDDDSLNNIDLSIYVNQSTLQQKIDEIDSKIPVQVSTEDFVPKNWFLLLIAFNVIMIYVARAKLIQMNNALSNINTPQKQQSSNFDKIKNDVKSKIHSYTNPTEQQQNKNEITKPKEP